MSASKADKKRYWVALFLKDLELGQTFSSGQLHVTLAQWFVSDVEDEQIAKSFKDKFESAKKISVKVGKTVKFGPKKNVLVSLIRYSEELNGLHDQSLEWMEEVHGRWAVKNPYMNDQYIAHIRRRAGTRLKEGDTLEIDAVLLISADRQEDNLRTVAAKVDLL